MNETKKLGKKTAVQTAAVTDSTMTLPTESGKISGDVKISFWEKIAYALGDCSCNVVVAFTSSVLTFFYTDYMGVSAATIGLIMLISRIFDGGSDLLMGVIVDNTKSRHGKARVWILRMMLPFSIGTVALFTMPPNASDTAKAWYIFITYNFVTTIVYTAINLPYSTLGSLLTRNSDERSMANVLRMGLSPIVRMAVTALTIPLVQRFGDNQSAWIKVSSIYSAIALVLFALCFFGTKERVSIEPKEKVKIPLKQSFKALFGNKYWLISLGLWGLQVAYITVVGVNISYYCKYILGNTNAISTLTFAENIPVIIGILFIVPLLLKKVGKRNLALGGGFVALAGTLLLLVNPYSMKIAVISAIIRGIGQAPFHATIFSFIADSVEYGQWKYKIRQEGLIFSAASVGNKVGAGLVSAIIGGVLSFAGYNGMMDTQTPQALGAIKNMFIYGQVICWGLIILLLALYQLDKHYPAIMEDLKAREARGEM